MHCYPDYILYIVIFLVALCVGIILGIQYRKKSRKARLVLQKTYISNILDDAYKSAENSKKEAILEAKEEIHKLRVEQENEAKESKI